MVAVRQIGYLSGWAVAVGIGAAIAAQGTAHADSTRRLQMVTAALSRALGIETGGSAELGHRGDDQIGDAAS